MVVVAAPTAGSARLHRGMLVMIPGLPAPRSLLAGMRIPLPLRFMSFVVSRPFHTLVSIACLKLTIMSCRNWYVMHLLRARPPFSVYRSPLSFTVTDSTLQEPTRHPVQD